MQFHHVAAAAALFAAIGVAGSPANAALTSNSLTLNALTINALTINALVSNALSVNPLAPVGSALADLNGVVVEAVRRDLIDGVEPAPRQDRRDRALPIVAGRPGCEAVMRRAAAGLTILAALAIAGPPSSCGSADRAAA